MCVCVCVLYMIAYICIYIHTYIYNFFSAQLEKNKHFKKIGPQMNFNVFF